MWHMRFQPAKCSIVTFAKNQMPVNLSKVDSIKYVGVTITNDLSWNKHIQTIFN